MGINVKAMQAKVERLLSTFLKLKATLEDMIEKLHCGIAENDRCIAELEEENRVYYEQINQFNKLKDNIDSFLG